MVEHAKVTAIRRVTLLVKKFAILRPGITLLAIISVETTALGDAATLVNTTARLDVLVVVELPVRQLVARVHILAVELVEVVPQSVILDVKLDVKASAMALVPLVVLMTVRGIVVLVVVVNVGKLVRLVAGELLSNI